MEESQPKVSYQDTAMGNICENNLDEEYVLIDRDWAMKFLPMLYHESQSTWFGKRGLNWNIAVVISEKMISYTPIQWSMFLTMLLRIH